MHTNSTLLSLATLLLLPISCMANERDAPDQLRFGDEVDHPEEPLFDESPLDCSDDPITIEVAEPIVVWPPNHKFTEVTLADCVASVSGGCLDADVDPNDVLEILSVTSDESENDNGDGNTCGDTIMITSDDMVKLLAERSGPLAGDGRVYTITFGVAEGFGEGYASCEVHVPLGHNVPVVNSQCQLCVADDPSMCEEGCPTPDCP